ncbi:MAG: hypothetical protein JW959_09225 [Pirellulales bacterium]|nr:hypothetical protein [Pirellulales bacterium]
MKTLIAAMALVLLLLGSSAYGAWWVQPTTVYYPGPPVYAYPAPVYAYPAPVYRTYRVPVAAPYAVYSPVVAPAPVWVGPPAVIVRGKVFIPGRPIRNAVRAVLP